MNSRFLQMCSHHLVQPVACTPAAGWEKGRVEKQIQDLRRVLFTPQPSFEHLEQCNQWLSDQCIHHAKTHTHTQFAQRKIYEVFENEQAFLIPYAGDFDAFRSSQVRVSKTCLVRFDNNNYSVSAQVAGQVVEVYGYAERVVIRKDGEVVGEHKRLFSKGNTAYDAWHYVPVLTRKPGRCELERRFGNGHCRNRYRVFASVCRDMITPETVVAEIDTLLEEHIDSEIADILNQHGHRSGHDLAFNAHRVLRIRRDYKLKSHFQRLRERGHLTLTETAETLGICPDTVKKRRRAGLICGYRVNDKNECLYQLPVSSNESATQPA